jgi:hypothetical protein
VHLVKIILMGLKLMIALYFVTPDLSRGLMNSNEFLALATSLSATCQVNIILFTRL